MLLAYWHVIRLDFARRSGDGQADVAGSPDEQVIGSRIPCGECCAGCRAVVGRLDFRSRSTDGWLTECERR